MAARHEPHGQAAAANGRPPNSRAAAGGGRARRLPYLRCLCDPLRLKWVVAFRCQWWHSGGVMPTVSLRLSDSELAQLREWAFGARRSLQREIVWRLFDGGLVGAGGSAGGVVARAEREPLAEVSGGAAAPRVGPSVPASPSGSGATVPGVAARPHMKRDRPAVECPTRVPAGEVCPDCGKAT